ncbi:unnamed protein product [Auanema sp. JU1783]|nr:unnamed protein product [Auanema sp. JU1783]
MRISRLFSIIFLFGLHLISFCEFVDPNEPYSQLDDGIEDNNIIDDSLEKLRDTALEVNEIIIDAGNDEDDDIWILLKSLQSLLTKAALVISMMKALQRCCTGLWDLIFRRNQRGATRHEMSESEDDLIPSRKVSKDSDSKQLRRRLKLPLKLAKEIVSSELEEAGITTNTGLPQVGTKDE